MSEAWLVRGSPVAHVSGFSDGFVEVFQPWMLSSPQLPKQPGKVCEQLMSFGVRHPERRAQRTTDDREVDGHQDNGTSRNCFESPDCPGHRSSLRSCSEPRSPSGSAISTAGSRRWKPTDAPSSRNVLSSKMSGVVEDPLLEQLEARFDRIDAALARLEETTDSHRRILVGSIAVFFASHIGTVLLLTSLRGAPG